MKEIITVILLIVMSASLLLATQGNISRERARQNDSHPDVVNIAGRPVRTANWYIRRGYLPCMKGEQWCRKRHHRRSTAQRKRSARRAQ